MGVWFFITAIFCAMTLSGCGSAISVWRHDATVVVDRIRTEGASQHFPEEYQSVEEAMAAGEVLFTRGKEKDADSFFLLALTKGKMVEEQLREKRRREDEKQKRLEAAKQEQLRQLKEQQEEEQRKLQRQRAEQESRLAEAKRKQDRARPVIKERAVPLPTYHTAKRGETLPLIAAQPDVYNDANLWPLLYRANRDQIKDPRQIWPGQVLRIPRNVSRDDIAEARRYSYERPIH